MVTPTPRFELGTYEQFEEWDHTDTVETFDELAIEKDVISNRPSEGTYDDELFLATDQNILYRWDENAFDWNIVGGVGTEANPLDAVYTNEITATNADISQLISNLDVNGNNLTNINSFTASSGEITTTPTGENAVTNKGYVDSVAQGLNWQESVIDELNDPPTTPSDGDRYLINDAPTGDWSGHANEITEYDGDTSSWVFFVPDEGWAVFVEDIDRLKVYDTSDWIDFGSAIHHGSLSGLTDDDHTQYYHVDGRRALTGNVDVGGNNITNTNQITSTSGDFDSLNAGETITDQIRPIVGIRGLQIFNFTIADDSVATFDQNNKGQMSIAGRSDGQGTGVFGVGFNGLTTLALSSMSNEGQATLNGTTGPDGTLNVASDSGTVYIENRTGQEEDYVVTTLGV